MKARPTNTQYLQNDVFYLVYPSLKFVIPYFINFPIIALFNKFFLFIFFLCEGSDYKSVDPSSPPLEKLPHSPRILEMFYVTNSMSIFTIESCDPSL